MNEPRGGEGERRLCGTLLVVEAVRAQASVAVFSALQPRVAGGSVLAFVFHTAIEFNVTVVTSPRKLTLLHLRTMAGVGSHAIFTPAAVLTGLALAFINVDLTSLT